MEKKIAVKIENDFYDIRYKIQHEGLNAIYHVAVDAPELNKYTKENFKFWTSPGHVGTRLLDEDSTDLEKPEITLLIIQAILDSGKV